MHSSENTHTVCQRIRLSGVVQGVGFRPLVWRLAHELKLTGWVRNDAQGVEIEVCGRADRVEQLIQSLHRDAPPFARIDAITSRYTGSVSVSEDFFILDSRGGRSATMIGQDTTVCRNCLGDMFDPGGRRWRYAFTSCSHCGPRYSICRGLPFDRARTTLKPFAMCSKCQTEYRKPEDRRLHAEGNCCPKCGPQLGLLDAKGSPVAGDVIASALAMLRTGMILAIKGPGGFHLVCDAHNAEAVARMRERKKRRIKPFPVMLANAISATTYVQLSVGEPGLLNLPERPIILLNKRSSCDAVLPNVAPGLPWLGVVLPFSPIYYLLFHEAADRPVGLDWLDKSQHLTLMLSSGNPGREPLVIDNDEAVRRLAGIADGFLVHDREIVTRCDDSIAFSGAGGLQLIRRARGYAPRAVKLIQAGPPVLAVGAETKTTLCVTRGNEAFVSQHIGDLTNGAAREFFDETVAHLLKMLDVSPALVAHDVRCETHATRYAREIARQRGIPLVGVQHHHAHIAAVLAEHHVSESVVGLALDGGGAGLDDTLWGGELLRVEGAQFERLSHLAPYWLIGSSEGESRMPWRIAAAVLHELGRTDEIAGRFPEQADAESFAEALSTAAPARHSTALGCLFDAAAALLGISMAPVFKGQAGLLLEGMAERHGHSASLPDGWKIENGCLNLWPLFAALADETNAHRGAAMFHVTLANALIDWLLNVTPDARIVAAAGGCMQNQVLSRNLRELLSERGVRLLEARRVPPNDGGLSLGQAWVAQHYLIG